MSASRIMRAPSLRKDRRSRSPNLVRDNNSRGGEAPTSKQDEEDQRHVVLFVGRSAAPFCALLAGQLTSTYSRSVKLLYGSTRRDEGEATAKAFNCEFVLLNSLTDVEDIAKTLLEHQVDLVVNALEQDDDEAESYCNGLINAAIRNGCHFFHVAAGRLGFAVRAKVQFHKDAMDKGSICILTAGPFPGLPGLIAADLVEQGGGAELIRFDYFLPGLCELGYADTTLTNRAFPLAVVSANTKAEARSPFTGRREVDFGPGVGVRSVYHLAFLEAISTVQAFRTPNVRAMIGFRPNGIRPLLFIVSVLTRCIPRSWGCHKLGNLMMNMTKPWSWFRSEPSGMRIAVLGNDRILRIHRQVHQNGVQAAADTVARQLVTILLAEEKLKPGVWFPEEVLVGEQREQIIEQSVSTSKYSDSTTATTVDNLTLDSGDMSLEEDLPLVWIFRRVLTAIPLTIVLVVLLDWTVQAAFPLLVVLLLWFP